MDWKAISSRLGAVSDSLTGSNHFSNIAAQEANNATANRQIDVGVQQNTENNELKKLLQQIQIAADTLSQEKEIGSRTNLLGMQQGFTGTQNRYERAQRDRLNEADIASRRELAGLQNTGALERTMAPLKFEDDRFRTLGGYTPIPDDVLAQDTFKRVPRGTTWGGMELLGKAGQAAGNYNDPFMMHGGYGAAKLQAEETQRIIDMAREAQARKGSGGGFWSNLFGGSPGVRPTGMPAPRVSPFTPGK